eukprot:c24987_g1_i2 orf=259-1194(+)
MEPALFSAADFFTEESNKDAAILAPVQTTFAERSHAFPGMALRIREFSFHPVNANLLWPGVPMFAEWLLDHQNVLHGQRVLELGSGTGALAIFLKKALQVDITTSDFDDEEIEKNIAYNCELNGVSPLQHIRHTWGNAFPVKAPNWDLIIASDILLYVKQYGNLIKTIYFLLQKYTSCRDTASPYHARESFEEQKLYDIAVQEELEGFVEQNNTRDRSSSIKIVQKMCSNLTSSETGSILADRKDTNVNIFALNPGQTDEHIKIPRPCFLMSWRRRIPKDEALFFDGCEAIGLCVHHLGSRIYCISLRFQI